MEIEMPDQLLEEYGPELPDRTGTALARREQVGGLLRPVAEPSDVLAAQEETRALIEKALKPGRDFDTIPGTSKPTLLKPGGERIAAAFGCSARYRIADEEVDHDRAIEWTKRRWDRRERRYVEESGTSRGLYRYVVVCELVSRAAGVVVGTGLGAASTLESKYVDRPRDLENVILKMAKKRAFVDAVLTTFGLSEQFTQDLEDGGAGSGDAGPVDPDAPLGFGKHGEKTWREVARDEFGYLRWLRSNTDKLSDDDWQLLEEIHGFETGAGGAESGESTSDRDQAKRRMVQAIATYCPDASIREDVARAYVSLAASRGEAPARIGEWSAAHFATASEDIALRQEAAIAECRDWLDAQPTA